MVAKAHCIFTPFDSVTGAALLSATVNVYNPGTVTPISATIYDKNSNPLSNPLTSDASTGLVDFYLTVAQTVDLNVSKTGYTTRTYSNVMVLDDAGFDNTAVLTTTGDMLYASANNVPARLPVSGTTGALLNVAAGVPAWSTVLQLSTSANAVGLATPAVTTTGLLVAPANLTGVSQVGIEAGAVYGSAATTQGIGVYSLIQTAAAVFTMASGYCYQASTPILGAGSAITNQYGFYAVNQGASGVTNAYGVYIAAQSGAATLNWGLFNAGTTSLTGSVTLAGSPSGQTIQTNDTVGLFHIQDSISIANAGVAQLVTGSAAANLTVFICDSGAFQAIFALRGGGHSTVLMATTSQYSITANTASSTNVYWSAGNSRYEIQNNTGGTLTYAVWGFGHS